VDVLPWLVTLGIEPSIPSIDHTDAIPPPASALNIAVEQYWPPPCHQGEAKVTADKYQLELYLPQIVQEIAKVSEEYRIAKSSNRTGIYFMIFHKRDCTIVTRVD
jgi:hypothetical protein